MLRGANDGMEANLDLRHLHGDEAVASAKAASEFNEPPEKIFKDK